jgi:predicted nuclease of predicted toxin-antitoxin system
LRIKLDENIPVSAATIATQLGHDVDTVVGENLTGATDTEVLAAATQDGRLLITLDRGLGDIRSYPPGTPAGVVVLRVDSQDANSVADAVRSLLANDELGDLTGCIVIVRGHLVRIRRPDVGD